MIREVKEFFENVKWAILGTSGPDGIRQRVTTSPDTSLDNLKRMGDWGHEQFSIPDDDDLKESKSYDFDKLKRDEYIKRFFNTSMKGVDKMAPHSTMEYLVLISTDDAPDPQELPGVLYYECSINSDAVEVFMLGDTDCARGSLAYEMCWNALRGKSYIHLEYAKKIEGDSNNRMPQLSRWFKVLDIVETHTADFDNHQFESIWKMHLSFKE